MLFAIGVILAVLWALGLLTSYTLGGFLHLFIVVSVALLALRLIGAAGGRRRSTAGQP
jgi:hypothetical protein